MGELKRQRPLVPLLPYEGELRRLTTESWQAYTIVRKEVTL